LDGVDVAAPAFVEEAARMRTVLVDVAKRPFWSVTT
jgi:hypothetical protein